MNAIHAFDLKAYQPDTSSIAKKPKVTEEEYWDKYYDYSDVNYEWNNGELEEKGVSDFGTYLTYKWLMNLLEHFLRTKPIAQTIGLETGFSLVLPHKTTIRKPDLGVVLNSNQVPLLLDDNRYQGIFDLCIEAVSDSSAQELKRDTVTKKQEYAQGGVKEYYILDGHARYTAFYRLSKQGLYVPIKPTKGDLIQSTVLPGFQFRIADLSKRPSPDEMIDDAVYQGFVLLGYQDEKRARQQAEQQAAVEKKARQQAEQQVEAEKRARQQAEQQTQQLVAQLRSLGINPDDLFKKQ